MKTRRVITNILYVITLLMLAGFLVMQILNWPSDTDLQKTISSALLAVAIFCVLLVEIVFPLIYNRKKLAADKKYLLLAIVKIILFIAAAAMLFLYEPFGRIKNMYVALIGFIVLYFAQFFINLDPKAAPKADPQEEEAATLDDGEEVPAVNTAEEIAENDEPAAAEDTENSDEPEQKKDEMVFEEEESEADKSESGAADDSDF